MMRPDLHLRFILLGCITLLELRLLTACSGAGGYAGAVEASSSSSSTASTESPSDLPGPTTGAEPPLTSTSAETTDAEPPLTSTSTESTGEAGPGTGSTGPGDPASCGNGVIDFAEECDESYASNSDSGSCTLQCKSAKCGDGLVWLEHEQCDKGADNNDVKYGKCTTSCVWGARCNDGVLQKSEEECDLGELNNTGESLPGGVPCTSCLFDARKVFLSSVAYTAKQLGGLTGADLACVELATNAKFDNAPAFLAWLSSSQASPESRFKQEPEMGGSAYVLPDGRRIADDWNDLVAHGPDDGITITELGTELVDARVWTNTDAYGGIFDPDKDCDGWTTDDFLATARVGRSGVYKDPEDETEWDKWQLKRQWTSFDSLECVTAYRIYCFEQ